ncbi:hypothetical protein [Noviherbaspirillum aerium]|uniref:hypothetical protein n=1 Tax=Noviherbaspirillum aerium TaxID=2588497 RepID=UPI00124E970B|nr:hypothetical protein [Noviherbaspirillum aerium]
MLEPDVPPVVELPDAPLLPPVVPDEPDEEFAPDGLCTVVVLVGVCTVVVVTVLEVPPLDDAPLCAGSFVVVIVVVLCPNAAVAVPISDRKMAIGNFFMSAPYDLD